MQSELGGIFLLKLNTSNETDSEQVARAKVEKNFEKRVKST